MATKVKTKIWWRDFIHTPAFQRMQRSLAKDGHHLKIIWEDNSDQKVAKDIHIFQVTEPVTPQQ